MDGYYYCDYMLKPGEYCYFFDEIYFTNAQGESTTPEGYHLQVEFIAEIVDTDTVDSVWPVTKDDSGSYIYVELIEDDNYYNDYLNWH